MLDMFSASPLPEFMTLGFSYTLPFLELITGLFLVVGFKTEKALNLGTLIIMSLVHVVCISSSSPYLLIFHSFETLQVLLNSRQTFSLPKDLSCCGQYRQHQGLKLCNLQKASNPHEKQCDHLSLVTYTLNLQ